ncbi:MAG: hypothetical protein J7M21_02440 [Planctomycetes bacterium]|nr:hypothetical protein [Planctomycetota bacterium]
MGFDLADDRSVVPAGVYTHPEIASVGLDLAQARRRFGSARVFRYNLSGSGTAMAYGRTAGHLKVVADPDGGRIYGALWIAPHAVDMIQEFALAMRSGLTMKDIYRTIHAHPTFQEAAVVTAEMWTAQLLRRRRRGDG